jgi:predicted small metal-binding protein
MGVSIMATMLEKIECDPGCGFMVRSHDEKELIDLTKLHVKTQHNQEVTDDSLRGMIKVA